MPYFGPHPPSSSRKTAYPATSTPPKLAVIISHPRSGTHLAIDFLRRNFASFNLPLSFGDSASLLYLNADNPEWERRLEAARNRWPRHGLIIHSHQAGLDPARRHALLEALRPQAPVVLYPFRRMSETLRSFAEYCAYRGDLRRWPGTADPFFGTPRSVGSCLEAHAQASLAAGSTPLDMDQLLTYPCHTSARLGSLLRETPLELIRRVPHKKISSCRVGELFERLRGRESTAVVVPRQARPQAEDLARLEDSFSMTHRALSLCSVNQPD